tara:strand:- start:3469 stop:6765 length:3297 start_codon:yes stop_codon:yes gene_type:complete
MALSSPGVEVSVIDESFYTPAAAGTVPMIFVTSASNKTASSGAGTAAGTLTANAGKPYLITSQRELGETFGDPLFYSDANGNMIHGGELNEYGLQTAYSLLGVTNRVYVCRADLDLNKLQASATAPGGEPANGAYWFDTDVTKFGILEWNSASVTTTGGQSFNSITPTIITELTDVTGNLAAPGAPKAAVGAIGDYAVVAISTLNTLWKKNSSGAWVAVGSNEWQASNATVRGTKNVALNNGDTITLDGSAPIDVSGTSITDMAAAINGATVAGVTAAVVNNALEIYSSNSTLVVANGTGTLLTDMGITAGTYNTPAVVANPHTNVPQWKGTATVDATARPTGSIWLKTTTPNGGADFGVKSYNADTQLWNTATAPLYATNEEAIYGLDKTGGTALAIGDLYVKVNVNEDAQTLATWKIMRRAVIGVTKITSPKITADSFAAGSITFTIDETLRNTATYTGSPQTVTFTATGATTDADLLAGQINSIGLVNVSASVDAANKVVISHKLGGDFRIVDTNGSMTDAGFVVGSSVPNLYYTPGTDGNTSPKSLTASNWKVLTYTPGSAVPLSLTADGEVWYSSVVDEVDIMIHDGNDWVGYQNFSAGYASTNAAGPQVTASAPTEQDDASPLVDGDLWISTADLETFPNIYRYNATLAKWVLIDKSDQTTENGILFADARYGKDGGTITTAPTGSIAELVVSNYKDPDAPDPALYPKGMMLWNLRRSGFNVKRFERNYVDVTIDNARYKVDEVGDYDLAGAAQDTSTYYPHRWVTDSGNNEDGSGTFGRHAQRKSVVQALQAMVNGNTDIRDEESRQYNLIAAPGYPELIGEMITLNYDRRLTGFVVGDTPARLTPDATSLNEWATNVKLAVEDNDNGAVSRDEYMSMFYPWGFTSDNAGNNVVVPPSHMALRTMVINDQVAFPWFAPAGTRRGGVTNATASGYITSEGEFQSVALNTGQRDTLYANNINPITFISGAGLVVFGQKTRARNASALDRINVARLVVYMRGQLELLARPYLFEPNDKITRDQIKAAADAFCLELVSLRGLYDYLVVCDESNNTPSRIDRNELYLDIAIEPVKAIEFIYIPLRIKNTGEIAALG